MGVGKVEGLQRWWEEHSELDRLVATLEETLAGGSLRPTLEALDELADALEAHFSVEERVYFPLVEKFSPQHAVAVRGARHGHALVSESMNDLRELIERGELVGARRTLAVLLERFRTHEDEEARLIAELEIVQGRAAD